MDLISRQAAIEVADAVWSVTGDKNVAKVWDQLKDLPSAQPERKREGGTNSEEDMKDFLIRETDPCSNCQEFDCYGCEYKH